MTSVVWEDGAVDHDATRWDERYRTVDAIVPRMPEAIERDDALQRLVPRAGRAVDVACGPGAQALWSALRGLDVVALDVSRVAIDLLADAATRLGVADRIDARVTDLDDGLPEDLTGLDLVVCQRFRDPRLYAAVVDRLRPGGLAIVTVLSEVGCDDPGAFHAVAGELSSAFTTPETEILHHHEGGGLASIVVRRR